MVRFRNNNIHKSSAIITDATGTVTSGELEQLNFIPSTQDRDVGLPAPDNGLFVEIINTGSAGKSLKVKRGGSTIATIDDGEAVPFVADGTSWRSLGAIGGAKQNLFETVDGDTGSAKANLAKDTMTISGGVDIHTSAVADAIHVNTERYDVKRNVTGAVVYKTGGVDAKFTGTFINAYSSIKPATTNIALSAGGTDPIVTLKNTTTDLGGGLLNFPNDKMKFKIKVKNPHSKNGITSATITMKINDIIKIGNSASNTTTQKSLKMTIQKTKVFSGTNVIPPQGVKVTTIIETAVNVGKATRAFNKTLKLQRDIYLTSITWAGAIGGMNFQSIVASSVQGGSRDYIARAG